MRTVLVVTYSNVYVMGWDAMAHPENGTLVPACVQHSVLEPGEDAGLRTLLPLVERDRGAARNKVAR